MRRSTKRLSLLVAIAVVGCLAAGCGGTVTSSIGSLPSRTATVSARPSATAITQPPTQSATTSAPSAPSSVSATPGASSGTSLLWLWILLGVVVVAGLIALIARSARRRSAAAAGQRSRLIDAYAKGSALHDAMSAAEAPGGLAAADAGARWSDIQRRADDLAQTLYALREAVPKDSGDRARIDDTLASLQAVRSAMDAERASGGASLGQAEVVRSRLASFESSLRALRVPSGELPHTSYLKGGGCGTIAGHAAWYRVTLGWVMTRQPPPGTLAAS
jgi:hypothetical protein